MKPAVRMRHTTLSAVLAASLAALPPAAGAALVGTGEAVAGHQAAVDRSKVKTFLERANVKERLVALGVDAILVGERVDALSDDEVAVLAQKVEGMPAGGHLEKTDYIIILLIAILVAIIA